MSQVNSIYGGPVSSGLARGQPLRRGRRATDVHAALVAAHVAVTAVAAMVSVIHITVIHVRVVQFVWIEVCYEVLGVGETSSIRQSCRRRSSQVRSVYNGMSLYQTMV